MVKPHCALILEQLVLPLLLMSASTVEQYKECQIEYIRCQVDNSDNFNIKASALSLIRHICTIKETRRQKTSHYLTQYLAIINTWFGQCEQNKGDYRYKEAIMLILGTLSEPVLMDPSLYQGLEQVLQTFVFPELSSNNEFLVERALWVYEQYAKLPMGESHLMSVASAVFNRLYKQQLPVRVASSLTLNALLHHESIVSMVRPALNQVLMGYLKIMDDIEFD
jgi:hypothetical protein